MLAFLDEQIKLRIWEREYVRYVRYVRVWKVYTTSGYHLP